MQPVIRLVKRQIVVDIRGVQIALGMFILLGPFWVGLNISEPMKRGVASVAALPWKGGVACICYTQGGVASSPVINLDSDFSRSTRKPIHKKN